MREHIELSRKTIRELKDLGVILDAHDDLDIIAEIMLCARRVLEPTDPALARRLLSPVVTVGGADLRCLPWGVQEALRRLLDSCACQDMDRMLAEAYASAHAQDAALWQAPPSPREFLRRVRRWARRLDATPVEIVAALEELAEREYVGLQAIANGGGCGLQMMLETLVREYGHDQQYWLWEATIDEVEALLCAIGERHEAEALELAKASRGKDKLNTVSADSYRFRAMTTLIALRDRIAKEKTTHVES